MKFVTLMTLYAIVFMGYFFLLSTIGLLWIESYKEIISCQDWFYLYSMLIGWWVSWLAVEGFSKKLDI